MCDAPSFLALPQSTPRVSSPGRSGIFTAVVQSCLSLGRNKAMTIDVGGSSMVLRIFFRLFLLVGLLSGLSGASFAQSTAVLSGTVTDATGAAVPNARVVATNQATGIESTTQTDTAGAYLFPSLPIGIYRLTVSGTNFQTAVVTDLKLQVASTLMHDVQLKVGQTTDTIEITADAAVVDTTNWLVNGINLNDNVQNQITFQPPINTLAEYKIDNSTFPAQYGRNAGAIVNLATRSGTNDYHGELFEFFRNNALDARNFFNLASAGPQAPFKRNDFGASFGGPIKKNKIFFFLAYEGLRQHQSLTVTSTRVPSQNERAAVTSPAIQSLIALIPAANLAGTGNLADPATFNKFTGGALANVALNQGSADLDVELTSKDRIHAYYVVQKDLRQEPTAGGAIATNLPGFGDTRDGFRHLMTFSEDHIFGPSLTNTVRLGFNRLHLTFTPNALEDPQLLT